MPTETYTETHANQSYNVWPTNMFKTQFVPRSIKTNYAIALRILIYYLWPYWIIII